MSFWRLAPSVIALGILVTFNPDTAAQTGETWPTKPVRVIVNFGPGGSSDNSMRPFAERLSRALGQQFVIENRGGASGALGIEAVMKSPPDGYTYVVTPALSVAILPHLRPTPYHPIKDLLPVTQFTDGTLLFAVHPSVEANSIQELVDYAKKNPGKLSWGTAGVGSHGHIICETFKLKAGVDILHVPYRGGGESLADFLAGVVQIHADPNTLPSVAAGKAKLLAVLDRTRLDAYPNVPMLSEIYPEIDFLGWFAMFAPLGTPQAIVTKMSQEMNKIARNPELRPLLLKAALAPHPGTPEELAALLQKDYERYGKLVRELNIRTE
jgi:tripartite-type tricarboxylate transporter receptor subunit TctC